ncbi:hypothetical protein LEP1GSC162_1700 [Leptospira santarosai str. CBC1531]|nr:hypothetical protein LEP1GSC162_1700 [Leptospira santarosai str. CBC1531]
MILREKALIFLLLYQKDQSARTQYLTPTCRSIGFVWKLSETLPKGRVSGSYLIVCCSCAVFMKELKNLVGKICFKGYRNELLRKMKN